MMISGVFTSVRVKHPLFTIWGGQIASSLGSTLTAFGLSLDVYEHTGSPLYMAGLLLAAMGPQIYFSFVAGAVVDFIGPKTTLVASNLASAAIVSVMLLSYNANNQMVWPLLLL